MNAIVAVDKNWAIGRGGDLLFSLPTDMKRFRSLTSGGTVIMGRKTLDSFPGGRPLPKRRNVVITRNADFSREGCECVSSPEEALALVEKDESVWLIGGGTIYKTLLPYCKRVCLTVVDAEAEGADTFFPNLSSMENWEVETESEVVEENGLSYRFIDYVNNSL